MTIDHRKLALIHIIKKELGLADEPYREILRRTAGVASARDLDNTGFRKLMRFLVRHPRYVVNPGGLTLRQVLFIRYLRDDLGWTEEHLRNFLHKYFHQAELQALGRADGIKVIEALKNVRRHRPGGPAAAAGEGAR